MEYAVAFEPEDDTVRRIAEREGTPTIASNTGGTSIAPEPAMTRKISLVAVCCSSASAGARCSSGYGVLVGRSHWSF